MTSLRSVTKTLTMADIVTTSAYQTRENYRFLSYLGWDNLGRIKISIPGLNTRFPYLVCKRISLSGLNPGFPYLKCKNKLCTERHRCCLIVNDANFFSDYNKGSDQTARMCRLLCVFVGRIGVATNLC